MKKALLVLPWPPSVNHYKKVGEITKTRSGKVYQRRYNSTETMVFYSRSAWAIQQEGLRQAFYGAFSLEVYLELYPPDKRRSDVDNRIKPILDALQRGQLFENDFQIAKLTVERKDIIPDGQVIVKITQLEPKC